MVSAFFLCEFSHGMCAHHGVWHVEVGLASIHFTHEWIHVKHSSPKFHMYTFMSQHSIYQTFFSNISCLSSYLNTLYIPQ
jgi:hypothetical protein